MEHLPMQEKFNSIKNSIGKVFRETLKANKSGDIFNRNFKEKQIKMVKL